MRKGILTLIFFSLLLASQPAMAEDPALIKKGYRYIEKGYISNAIPTFKKSVELYPKNVKAHLGLALSAAKQGGKNNLNLAIKHFKITLELDPKNYDSLTNLARILSWDVNTRNESIKLYRRALLLKPNDRDVKYQFAEVLTWTGNYPEAVDLFESLYGLKLNNPELNVKYANALTGDRQYDRSLTLYKNALNQKIKFDKYTTLNYARSLANTNYPEMACNLYQDLIRGTKNPKELNDIKKEFAGVLFDMKEYEKALEMDASIEPKDRDTLLRLARTNDYIGNKTAATELYENLYNTYPDDIEIKRAAAQYLAGIGGYSIIATKIYSELQRYGSATTDDMIALANLYNSSESTKDKAIDLYRKLLRDADLTSTQAEEIKITLARSLSSKDSTRSEAIQLYKQILQSEPDNKELHLEFIELLSWNDSTRREALVNYFELLNKYPNNPKIQNGFNQTLSWYLPGEGDLSLYEEILKKYPNNENALKGLDYFVSKYPEGQERILEIYKNAIASDPTNTTLQLQIANILAKDEKTRKEAIESYRTVYNQKPNDIVIMSALANNLLYEKQFKEAKEIYNKVLAVEPNNKDALLGKARIYSWQGLNLAALKVYEEAYQLYPSDPDIAYEYASTAQKLGKSAKALEILRKIKEQSLLPDAPDLAEVAMGVNYQATAVDSESYDNNLSSAENDINNLQDSLKDIQKSLDDLQKQLNQIQQVNEDKAQQLNNLDNRVTTYKNATQVTSATQETSTEESLPDPVKPSRDYVGKISYSTDKTTTIPPEETNTPDSLDEVSFSTDTEANCFRYTGFEDTLSGKQSELMIQQYGNLEKDILYLMRPEFRTAFVLSNEVGDPTSDGLEIHGYPSYVSFNLTPQNRVRFGITSFTYGMTPAVHPASITATSYLLGLNSKPHERVQFDAEIGINSFSDPNAPVDVTAKADLNIKLHDRAKLAMGYRREPLYQSVLDTTGYTVQPQYSTNQLLNILNFTSGAAFNPDNTINAQRLAANPAYYNQLRGPFVGLVRDNAVYGELTLLPINKWDVTFGGEYSAVRGENIQHNERHQAIFSFGRTFTGLKDHLFRVGYQFLFFGYSKDLSAFPNMTPYPYLENGQLIPVSRQLRYEEAVALVNPTTGRIPVPDDVFNFYNANPPTVPFVATRFQSPVDFIRAPQGVGIGGYFSPTQFYLNSFRLDFEGKLWNSRLSYKGGGSLGVQQTGDRVDRMDLLAARGLQNFANIPANDPRRTNQTFNSFATTADGIRDNTDSTSLASAFDFTLFFKLCDYLTLYSGVDYLNAGAFNRWRYNGGVIIRPSISALTPIFRKPAKANSQPKETSEPKENSEPVEVR